MFHIFNHFLNIIANLRASPNSNNLSRPSKNGPPKHLVDPPQPTNSTSITRNFEVVGNNRVSPSNFSNPPKFLRTVLCRKSYWKTMLSQGAINLPPSEILASPAKKQFPVNLLSEDSLNPCTFLYQDSIPFWKEMRNKSVITLLSLITPFTSGSMPFKSPIAVRISELSAITASACAAAAFTPSSSCVISVINMRSTSHSCSSFRFASGHYCSLQDILTCIILKNIN